MSDIAIKVDKLGKSFRLGQKQQYRTLRESLSDLAKKPLRAVGLGRDAGPSRKGEELWALKDVSFDVKHGEVIGIIGRNGAGKSTLLKVLSRITSPTEGSVELNGRVGSLLEVGTGFHPELTGRENIFLNGAILGMPQGDIRRKFDEIVAFSEIEKFLDTPVKRYSSGMYMRLAFAVAAHLEPEILVVDEVLAVGDAQFQKKCLGKMSDVARHGRTVLFVSHNMGAVASLCQRAIELANGKVQAIGSTDEIVRDYLAKGFHRRVGNLGQLRLSGYGREIRIDEVELLSDDGPSVLFGQPIRFRLVIESDVALAELSVGSSLYDALGACIGTLFTTEEFSIKKGQKREMILTVANFNLAPGLYYGGFSVGRGGHQTSRLDMDIVIGHPSFQILPISDGDEAVAQWHQNWGKIVIKNVQLDVKELCA